MGIGKFIVFYESSMFYFIGYDYGMIDKKENFKDRVMDVGLK